MRYLSTLFDIFDNLMRVLSLVIAAGVFLSERGETIYETINLLRLKFSLFGVPMVFSLFLAGFVSGYLVKFAALLLKLTGLKKKASSVAEAGEYRLSNAFVLFMAFFYLFFGLAYPIIKIFNPSDSFDLWFAMDGISIAAVCFALAPRSFLKERIDPLLKKSGVNILNLELGLYEIVNLMVTSTCITVLISWAWVIAASHKGGIPKDIIFMSLAILVTYFTARGGWRGTNRYKIITRVEVSPRGTASLFGPFALPIGSIPAGASHAVIGSRQKGFSHFRNLAFKTGNDRFGKFTFLDYPANPSCGKLADFLRGSGFIVSLEGIDNVKFEVEDIKLGSDDLPL